MKIFKLHIDCSKCNWIGMALVAAMSYDAAVNEYVNNGDSGEFVRKGEIVFTDDSKTPLEGLEFSDTRILCDITVFNS